MGEVHRRPVRSYAVGQGALPDDSAGLRDLLVGLTLLAVVVGGILGLAPVGLVGPGLFFTFSTAAAVLLWLQDRLTRVTLTPQSLHVGMHTVPWEEVRNLSLVDTPSGPVLCIDSENLYLTVRTFGPPDRLLRRARTFGRQQGALQCPELDALRPVQVYCRDTTWAAPDEAWLPPYSDRMSDALMFGLLALPALAALPMALASGSNARWMLSGLLLLVLGPLVGSRLRSSRHTSGLLLRAERGGLLLGDERIAWADVASIETHLLGGSSEPQVVVVLRDDRALIVRPPGSASELQHRLTPFLTQQGGRQADIPRQLEQIAR